MIVTFGAEGRTVDELFMAVARHAITVVVDVRRTPDSQGREWGREALKARLGVRYAWLRGLVATNLRSALAAGATAVYADLDAGLQALGKRLAHERVWRVLLLGDALDPLHDARGHLAQRFADDMGMTVVHDLPAPLATQEGLW